MKLNCGDMPKHKIFDLKFVNLDHSKKVGQIVVTNPTRLYGTCYSAISGGVETEDDVDKAINFLIAELEEIRIAAKKELLSSKEQETSYNIRQGR